MRRGLSLALVLIILGAACAPSAAPTPTPTKVPAPTATPTKAAATTPTVAAATTPATQAAAPAGDPVKGKALFSSVSPPCAGCHGTDAQGGIGPKVAGTTLDLDTMKKQIREPRSRKADGIMSAFSKEAISDEQIQDILAWLKTLK